LDTNEYAIQVQGLTCRYGKRVAVNGLDLSVRVGEFFGFLGPNGAGKSTTIRTLCGFLAPSSGTVTVAGVDVARDPIEVKRHIGILPEDAPLYDRLTAAEFLRFAGGMHGLSAREAKRRTEELLELMDLTAARDRLIADYSMGMRKKTALAAALLHGPRVLFLDEPFNGVDALSVRLLCNVLRELTERRGVTVFFTSHVMEAVERLCDRVAVLKEGRLLTCGTPDELRAHAALPPDTPLEEVYRVLIGAPEREASLAWLGV
jgi:ABC-2 type transport system ATP-binding protein